jgi:uncharacterized protein YyaL (SSP411 family)
MRWSLLLLLVGLAACAESPASPSDPERAGDGRRKGKPVKANHLAHEKSPYLLQHVHNPVDWYPWGEEALAKAKREGKPIFLSIGYATCHWCHVMERESFESEDVAEVLNRAFVPIKVDREERPDVDQIYMTAVQAMTGQGGWPLSVFLTPELEPFFGGTYFPPEDAYGRPGFKSLLLRIEKLWKERPDDLRASAAKLTAHLRSIQEVEGDDEAPGVELLLEAAKRHAGRFDERWGGFGPAPKFPPSMTLELLLRVHRRTGDPDWLRMVERTLDGMADGGLFDHLGGGFHRYSTDERWLVPHFEKMLYDNALLTRVYLDAYLVTGHERHARVARETLDYVLRDMTQPDGGFSSAEDADSEGEEGIFYVWRPDELREHLGDEDAALAMKAWGVTEAGNFEGRNILHRAVDLAALAKETGREKAEVEAVLARAREKLLAVRSERERPLLDDKVLTGWNGLMIGAMAAGYRVLGDERYLAAARGAADFLLANLVRDGRLLRRYREGEARHLAVLSDYAYFTAGLVDLYETTGEARWLEEAIRLVDGAEELFSDDETGAWFETGDDGEKLLVRPRDPYDGAIPAAGSILARTQIRLAVLTGREAYRERAARLLAAVGPAAKHSPHGFSSLLHVLDLLRDEVREVVIVGDPDDEGTRALREAAWRRFAPNRVIVLAPESGEAREAAQALVPLLEGRTATDGKPTAYVCVNRACRLPVTTPEELAAELER